MDKYTISALFLIIFALGAVVPLISWVQSVGKDKQLAKLKSLEGAPVAASQYYKIASNYFSKLEPFAISTSYFLPVLVLWIVTLACAGLTYFGALWTTYLGTPNYILGGALAFDAATPADKLIIYQSSTVAMGSAAFIGAYAYMVRVLLSRVNNDDLAPITYYYFTVRILLACLVAGIVRHALFLLPGGNSETELKLLIPLGFVIGLQPDLWVVALTSKITKKFELFGSQADPKAENLPSNLSLLLIEGLTDTKRDRLEELDVDNCQALAEHNPFVLWARTAYQLLQIIDWIAQAQLVILVKEEGIRKLRANSVRDIFEFEAALAGKSKDKIAGILGIDPTLTDDMLIYLRDHPTFKRLKDVFDTL